jgi:dTDP-4-amino-4,6-dideoxygalactose transaminase
MTIPFNKPAIFNDSHAEITSSLKSLNHSGKGPYTKKCEDWFKRNNPNILRAFLSTSCTHALEASAILLDLQKGDEVIVPSYTFVTTALSFYMHGATIRFCDIRPDTLNIDENLIENCITKKTKAIVVVHYAGISCEMNKITAIAKKYNLVVIEDNAHGLFGKYKGKNLGTLGNLSTLSFHETKNITCGEGGALFVRDPNFVERAEIIFDKGTNRSQFINGQVDKYSWVDKGSSYVLSDLLASLLYAQLKNHENIQNKREKLWNNYYKNLIEWSNVNDIQLQFAPSYCKQTYHMFFMVLPSKKIRNNLIKHLQERNINATFHYLPLDSSKMGVKIKHKNQVDCPISKKVSDCILRLPLYYDLTLEEQRKIIQAIKSVQL